MGQYKPFIDDPGHLARLDGQRFIVLRATSPVAEVWAHVRSTVRDRLSGLPVSYPAQPHVTLAGFARGTPLREVQELVDEWSPTVAPLRLEVERVASFPAPSQIVIVQVRKTPELFEAMAGLRGLAERWLLPVASLTPVDEWIFHLSVAYCRLLSAEAWSDVTAFLDPVEAPMVDCVVDQAELVVYDDGQEQSGDIYTLRKGEGRWPQM